MALPGVMELVRTPDDAGQLFDIRVTATGGWLEIDTTTNWYRERVQVQIDVRLVTTPERQFEFDSRSSWFDLGRVVSLTPDQGRLVSEYLQGRVVDYQQSAAGFAVLQAVEPAATPVLFRFARR